MWSWEKLFSLSKSQLWDSTILDSCMISLTTFLKAFKVFDAWFCSQTICNLSHPPCLFPSQNKGTNKNNSSLSKYWFWSFIYLCYHLIESGKGNKKQQTLGYLKKSWGPIRKWTWIEPISFLHPIRSPSRRRCVPLRWPAPSTRPPSPSAKLGKTM